jgi:hypothetical protein
MARVFSPLNVRQVEVLRWIADRCPDGVMVGFSYKTTALALQGRRLATVSKKGGVWRAAVSDAGRYYLEHNTYPTDPGDGRTEPARARAARDSPRPVRTAAPRPPRQPRVPAQPKPLPPTEQLIADLLANDGELTVTGPDRAKYEARVAAAIRFGKVPEGKQLVTIGGRWSTEYVVRLRDEPAWMNAPLDPIAVPATLRRPHPVITALQTEGLPGLDRKVLRRALLLIQALATAAQQRGYTARETKVTTDRYGYRHRDTKDQFSITVRGHGFGVKVQQEIDRTRHEPTAAEEARAARDTWYRIPKYDNTPSERLSLHLSGSFEHRQSKWTDTPTGSLESWLPQILQEIELRAKAAEAAQLAAIAAAEEKERQWERAMEQARRDYAATYRAQALVRQSAAWHNVCQVRDYLDAMQQKIDTLADPHDTATAREWHRWATAWAESTDPLAQTPAPPTVPEPKPDDLKPHLHGWSPYGREASRW